MSLRSQAYRRSALVALMLAFVVVLFPSFMSAQDQAPPKVDLFLGYQWLSPGGTVPVGSNSPFQTPPPPVATKLPGMPIGYGITATYNFDKWWGLWKGTSVKTGRILGLREHESSIGPKLDVAGRKPQCVRPHPHVHSTA
jgi:hypothetical protein